MKSSLVFSVFLRWQLLCIDFLCLLRCKCYICSFLVPSVSWFKGNKLRMSIILFFSAIFLFSIFPHWTSLHHKTLSVLKYFYMTSALTMTASPIGWLDTPLNSATFGLFGGILPAGKQLWGRFVYNFQKEFTNMVSIL